MRKPSGKVRSCFLVCCGLWIRASGSLAGSLECIVVLEEDLRKAGEDLDPVLAEIQRKEKELQATIMRLIKTEQAQEVSAVLLCGSLSASHGSALTIMHGMHVCLPHRAHLRAWVA